MMVQHKLLECEQKKNQLTAQQQVITPLHNVYAENFVLYS